MRQSDEVSTGVNVEQRSHLGMELLRAMTADRCKAVDSQLEIKRENGLSQNFLCLLQNKENMFENPLSWSVLHWSQYQGQSRLVSSVLTLLTFEVLSSTGACLPLLSKQQEKKNAVLSHIGRSVLTKCLLVCF